MSRAEPRYTDPVLRLLQNALRLDAGSETRYYIRQAMQHRMAEGAREDEREVRIDGD